MPAFNADRNLLFGILALQMDFIARDELVAAMHAWVLDKARPLGHILRDQGHLAEEEFALLEGLVRKHLEKHNHDPRQSLAAVSSIRSVRHDLHALADADVQASLVHVASVPGEDDPEATGAHVGPGTLPHARFHILRPHARGGLGEVFVARDEELKREVALKEIQERHAGQPESRARFLLEAEVTGALEHPGIVPVYGLGHYADGRPFYAMRFIKGDSLKDAIAAFHATEKTGRSDSERSLALRQLLGRFVDVCQAIAFAHSKGVLHRDLKPGNIMLGKYGETLVVDWGLAKLLGKTDIEATETALVGSGDSALTQAGRALGTPAFMSPEQAAGKLDELGPASDVYSLGATLYCLLAGQAPFTEGDVGAVLGKVQKGDFPPPRQLNSRVPAALEAICLRAMALKPQDRYASPRDLAGEIEHWLADEPVAAHREPLPARVARAARKRPALTAGIGALLVTGVIALGVSTLLVGQAQQRTDEQRQKAVQALRDRDEAERKRALAQIDALCDAAPGAVPGILNDLARSRDEVLDELRRRHDAEKDAAKKARLALALLPTEPDRVRAALVVRMLTVQDDPAEVVLIRDVLKPHSAGLAEGLWAKVDARDGRFRALVALAAFDPAKERWKTEAEELVKALLGENSLHLGAWVSALEPVSANLFGPLGKLFRDRGAENAANREPAAQALKLYLTRRPDAETLFELLLDADGKQYAILRPLLDAHREKAVARMNAELARTPDYWIDRPLDAAWPATDATLGAEIEKAGGLVAERWALCQALPLDRLAAVTAGLRPIGYRPVSVRPWSGGVAVVWTRDGRDWQLEQALTAEALRERDAHWRKAGLIGADVSAYATREGERYVGLWRRGEEGEQARLLAGVPDAKLRDEASGLQKEGLVPARVSALLGKDGVVRISGVWWQGKGKVEGENPLRWGEDEGLFAGHVADQASLLLDVSVSQAAPPGPLRDRWLADLKRARADADPHYAQGVALFNLGRLDQAKAAFEQYHKRSKQFFAHGYLALLAARAGDAGQARGDLAAWARATTDTALVAGLTAQVEIDLGNDDKALAALDEQVKKEKDADLAYQAACAHARAADVARLRQTAASAAALAGAPSLLALAAPPRSDPGARYAGRSLALLRQAIAAGYRDFATLQTEPALEVIRPLPGYAELLRDNGLLRQYSSVWRNDASRRAESIQGLNAEAHLARCRELVADGYRPVTLSLAQLSGEKSAHAASVWHRPIDLAGEQALARRQGNAAATLLVLKQPETVWPLFRHSADPTRRSWLVWKAGELGSDPRQLMARLEVEKDDSARRALILALGEYTEKELPAEVRAPLVKKLLAWYRDDPDSGVHAAIGWLLRPGTEGPTPRLLDWGQGKALDAIEDQLRGEKQARLRRAGGVNPLSGAGWYVNGQGQTMVRIAGPVDFAMGSRRWDPDFFAGNDRPHLRRIPRSFAIGATSVTVAQWERFVKEKPQYRYNYTKRYSPEAGGPIIQVDWYEAAAYCNWLSEKEGIPEEQWVYPREIGPGMKLPADYLRRTGYRLPTEAEMDFACKAGSEESRYFGGEISQLPRYAHFQANSKDRTWPVGQKRPNDLGLFDAHGNVWNWTLSPFIRYPQRQSANIPLDREYGSDILIGVDINMLRVLRGGSFDSRAPSVRSSSRLDFRPGDRNGGSGLRLCRTLPHIHFTTLPPP